MSATSSRVPTMQVFMLHGEEAGERGLANVIMETDGLFNPKVVLNAFLLRYLKDAVDLGYVGAQAILLPAIIRCYAILGNREAGADHYDALGLLLARASDPRALTCFCRALRLTSLPERRVRFMTELGCSQLVLVKNREAATRILSAAVLESWALGKVTAETREAELSLRAAVSGSGPAFPDPLPGQIRAARLVRLEEIPR